MPQNKIWKRVLPYLMLASLLTFSLSSCLSLGVEPASPDPALASQEDVPAEEATNDAFSLEVGIEPTPVPTSRLYTNSEYGYEFTYPETWQLEEIDQGVAIWKENTRLMIQVWWTNAEDPLVRWFGLPAGDLLYRDKQPFLEGIVPVHYLVYQEKIKQVLYNDGNSIPSGDLEILIYLESQETEYESIDLPETTIAEAKSILESFQVTGQAAPPVGQKDGLCATDKTDPPAGWQQYRNERYGFYLYYPESLQIYETGDHTMEIQQENGLALRMEFRRIDQEYPLPGIINEGEVELTRFVNYFGDQNPNPIVVERSGEKVTRVNVGNVFGSNTPVQFQVDVTGPTGMSVDLNQADRLLEILDYLCLAN